MFSVSNHWRAHQARYFEVFFLPFDFKLNGGEEDRDRDIVWFVRIIRSGVNFQYFFKLHVCASVAHYRFFLIIETAKGQSEIRMKRKSAQCCFCVWQRNRGNSNTKKERRKKRYKCAPVVVAGQSVVSSCEMNQCQSKEPLFLHILFVLYFSYEYPERSRMYYIYIEDWNHPHEHFVSITFLLCHDR